MPKQLLDNSKPTFKKSKKHFFGPQNGQITGTNFEKMAKISPKNLDFGGHQKIFWVDTTRKYGPSESKINA